MEEKKLTLTYSLWGVISIQFQLLRHATFPPPHPPFSGEPITSFPAPLIAVTLHGCYVNRSFDAKRLLATARCVRLHPSYLNRERKRAAIGCAHANLLRGEKYFKAGTDPIWSRTNRCFDFYERVSLAGALATSRKRRPDNLSAHVGYFQ